MMMKLSCCLLASFVAFVSLGKDAMVLVSFEGNRIEQWKAPEDGKWTREGVVIDCKRLGIDNKGIAAANGTLYVADVKEGGRILKFGMDGTAKGMLTKTGMRPDQLCISPDGRYIFVSSIKDDIFRFELETGKGGRFIDVRSGTRGIKFGADGKLFACSRDANEISVYDVSDVKPRWVVAYPFFALTGALEFLSAEKVVGFGSVSEVVDLSNATQHRLGGSGDISNAIGACRVGDAVCVADFERGNIWRFDSKGGEPTVVATGVKNACALLNLDEQRLVAPKKAFGYGELELAPGSDFERMSFNNPDEVIFLKAGNQSTGHRIMDYNGDGQEDIVVKCGWSTWPWVGTYVYLNPTPQGKRDIDPVFPKAIRLKESEFPEKNFPPCYDKEGKPFGQIHYTEGFRPKGNPSDPEYWHGRQTKMDGDRQLIDIDGDGIEDLLIRRGDEELAAMQNCYDARGNWMTPQLRAFVYVCKGLGDNRYEDPKMIYLENELPLEVYGGWSMMAHDWDGDGDVDLILVDFMDTSTYFENVGTKTNPVFTSGRFLRTPDGSRLQWDLCMPKCSAHDWDKDGRLDIIVVEEDSRVSWCRNTGVVKNGMPVFEQPRYFRQRADELHFGVLSCPYAVDWDGDGDQDLIVGDAHGQIAFIENLSGKGVEKPKWAAPKYLTTPDGKKIWHKAMHDGSHQGLMEWKWGYMTVTVADWDGDGLLDVMGNDITGRIWWWKNLGTRKEPKMDFARRVEVEWEGEQPELAWGWRKPKHQENPKDLLTQWRTTPVMTDWNGDGLTDLIVLDTEGYLAYFERARTADGRLIVKSPRRAFTDKAGAPLRLRCGYCCGIGCGRRKFSVCDWDGDGKMDILANGNKNVELYRQVSGDGNTWRFESRGNLARRQLSTHDPQPAACDFNGDGIPDVMLGVMDGFIYYYRNPRSK